MTLKADTADQQFMQRALELADQAAAEEEVPVGAVVVAGREYYRRGLEPDDCGRRPHRPCGMCGP